MLVGAGCATSKHAAPPTSTTVPSSSSTLPVATTAAGSALTTPGPPTTQSTAGIPLPMPSASAPLSVGTDIDLGVAPPVRAASIFAEGPDGAVFYAAGGVIYVVDGDSPPAVALHPDATVLALAVSSTNLVVVTPSALVSYSRSTGNRVGSWPLTASPGTPTSAGVALGDNGMVWVWTDWATDFSGYEYATLYVIPSDASQAFVVSQKVDPGSLVAAGSDAYFVQPSTTTAGGRLVEWVPSAADPPGVQVLGAAAPPESLAAFYQGQIVLDSSPDLYLYNPAQSAGGGATEASSVKAPVISAIAGTGAGLLLLTCPNGSTCDTIIRFDQVTGATESSLNEPGAEPLVLGPYPAVVAVESGQEHLIRLG